jgi:uncharacterized protein (DUF983 family)
MSYEFTTFIQWKGTDLCMDFMCPECGCQSHFDGYFAYYIDCPSCDSRFEMPTDVPVKKVEKADGQLSLMGDD